MWCFYMFLPFWLGNVLRATTACTFFGICTSKSGPKLVCFVHFDLEICFAPQQRALFRHLHFQSGPRPSVFDTFHLEMCFAPQRRTMCPQLNFQKWSETISFWHFWLRNVLRATTACAFSTSQLQKVPRPWVLFSFFASKRASRHNGVQLFICHLASWLRTRRFSKPTYRPSRATNHWKKIVNRDFPTFSCNCIFFLLSLSLLWSSHFLSSPPGLFTPLLFHFSILSEVWLLNFLRLYIHIHIHTHTYIYILLLCVYVV